MSYRTLFILVEGETEFAIVKRFLQPYWEQRFKRCEVINYKGSGNLKAKYVERVRKILSQPDQAALVLIDIKNDPYDIQNKAVSLIDAYQRIRHIMYAGLGLEEHDRLGIFPVVVEVETWLLADPTIQQEYLKKEITHPEHEPNPELEIKRLAKYYKKGLSAKKYFDKASALDVYNDNCPHFVYLANWLSGKPFVKPEVEPDIASEIEEIKERAQVLQMRYEELNQKIEANLKRGQTAAAGLQKAEQEYIKQQINKLARDLW